MDLFVKTLALLHKSLGVKREALQKKLKKHKKVLAYSVQHKRDDAVENKKIKQLIDESIDSISAAIYRGDSIMYCIQTIGEEKMGYIARNFSIGIDMTDDEFDTMHKKLFMYMVNNIDVRNVSSLRVICMVATHRQVLTEYEHLTVTDNSHFFEFMPKDRILLLEGSDAEIMKIKTHYIEMTEKGYRKEMMLMKTRRSNN